VPRSSPGSPILLQHSYVDLEKDFYKRISENVVRSGSEARQVLLQATNSGEVNRLRIVQALGFISRRFSDALKIEIDQNAPLKETGLVIGTYVTLMSCFFFASPIQ
jgi:hypothetical protein